MIYHQLTLWYNFVFITYFLHRYCQLHSYIFELFESSTVLVNFSNFSCPVYNWWSALLDVVLALVVITLTFVVRVVPFTDRWWSSSGWLYLSSLVGLVTPSLPPPTRSTPLRVSPMWGLVTHRSATTAVRY